MRQNFFPTQEQSIRSARPDEEVIVWAACTLARLGEILSHRTAGGRAPVMRNLLGNPSRYGQTVRVTSSTLNANLAGIDQHVVAVSVQKRFLIKRQGSLNGWDCDVNAPVKVLGHGPGSTTQNLKFG